MEASNPIRNDEIKRLLTTVLEESPDDIQQLGQTAQASVYRVTLNHPPMGRDSAISTADAVAANGGKRSWIIKLVNRAEPVVREVETYRHVVCRLDISSPRVIGHGLDAPQAWVSYTDDELTPVDHTVHRYREGLEIAARLHSSRLPSDWPVATLSHTPSYAVVLNEVAASHFGRYELFLRQTGFSNGITRSVQALMQTCLDSPLNSVYLADVVCHGDMHLGNWMWSRRYRRVFLIDWEYVHLDSAYFDLFQLLDVTSPTSPLTRVLSRMSALKAYHESRFLQRATAGRGSHAIPLRGFARGYITYAATHLLWIVGLIAEDMVNHRFQPDQMQRQLMETVTGLLQLHRDWLKLK